LDNNHISDNGAKALSDVLEHNSLALERLDLSNNQIGPLGASYLARSLYSNIKLKSLSLRLNPLGNDGAFVLAYALKSPKRITELAKLFQSLSLTSDGSNANSKPLENMINDLILSRVPPFSYLNLCSTGMGPSAMEQFMLLVEADGIESLDLSCNAFAMHDHELKPEDHANEVTSPGAVDASYLPEREKLVENLGKTVWNSVQLSKVILHSIDLFCVISCTFVLISFLLLLDDSIRGSRC
jgi:hypothetical protein